MNSCKQKIYWWNGQNEDHPHALKADQTEKFIQDVEQGIEAFDDQVGSLTSDIRQEAYKNFLTSYRDAMVPIWNLVRFASVKTVLNTITDKELTELAVLKWWLQPKPPTATVTKEQTEIPDLEAITDALKKKFPKQSLPGKEVCNKISDVFINLAAASKLYGEVAAGLTELANLVTPDQLTMLLCAATMPSIQVVVPGKLISPLTTPPPPQPEASTTIGRTEIINHTKKMVLPNPDSPELDTCDRNAAMHVLAAATYCKMEHHLFDETLSRADVVTAFKCNISQITKAVTGVIYKSGPHHYQCKGTKLTTERACDSTNPNPGTSKARCTDVPTASRPVAQTPTKTVAKDTLSSSSSSSDSDLPTGLASSN